MKQRVRKVYVANDGDREGTMGVTRRGWPALPLRAMGTESVVGGRWAVHGTGDLAWSARYCGWGEPETIGAWDNTWACRLRGTMNRARCSVKLEGRSGGPPLVLIPHTTLSITQHHPVIPNWYHNASRDEADEAAWYPSVSPPTSSRQVQQAD